MTEKFCRYCVFWNQSITQKVQWTTVEECRCNPPTVVYRPSIGDSKTVWPQTQAHDWCGKFLKNEN